MSAAPMGTGGSPAALVGRIPLVRSLRERGPGDVSADLAAGLTVGAMLIPQGMAYALLAGVPPVHGLYAALAPPVVYALLGTSRRLAVGPVAMDSLLVASVVAPLAAGDPGRYLSLAVLLAALVGSVQLLLGLLRAGYLANLLSRPVLAGFTSAAALIIATSQLGHLLGVPLERGRVHEILLAAVGRVGEAHPPTVLVGVVSILALVALRRHGPRLPGALLLVVAGTLLSGLIGMSEAGVAVVGEVPSGVPVPRLPTATPSALAALMPAALAIALVGYTEAIAIAKAFASGARQELDPNQELRALGAANLAGSLFQAFPVSGGFARTAVNVQAGARSQLSSVVGAGVIALTVLVLAPLFRDLPTAILAAIIVTAVSTLVDTETARELWRVDRRDFTLMIATFATTVAIGIMQGIVVGVGLSVAMVLDQIARPHVAVLGKLPGTDRYRNVRRHPDAAAEAGVTVVRMDASLFFGNAEAFRDATLAAFRGPAAAPAPRALVLDAYPMNRTDSTGLHVLREIVEEIRSRGGSVFVAGAKGPLLDTLERGGIVALVGPDRFFAEVAEAVEAAKRREDGGRSRAAEGA